MSSEVVTKSRKKGGLLRSLCLFLLLPCFVWAFAICAYVTFETYDLVAILDCASYLRSPSARNDDALLNGCSIGCKTTFGTILGAHNGVFAYSNCNSETCISKDFHILRFSHSPLAHNGIAKESGLKWQCVEYARRYWMTQSASTPASFASVEGAADIWSLEEVELAGNKSAPLLKYPNGAAEKDGGSAPLVGDLLIYPRQGDDFPHGHVAVVVGVTDKSVLVAEQNWDNAVWPAPHHNFSRSISFQHSSNNDSYRIYDGEVSPIGWMRYTSQ